MVDPARQRHGAALGTVRQEDPLLYDLVLNTASLGIEAAAGLVVEALRRRFPAPSR